MYKHCKGSGYKQHPRKPKLAPKSKKVLCGKKTSHVESKAPKAPVRYYPKDVKTKKQREVFDLFRLRQPNHSWGASFLDSDAGHLLEDRHWEAVKKLVEREKPQSKKALLAVIKKAMQMPQQEFIMLYEASMRGPLTPEAFQRYMTLFKENFPEMWQQIYGRTTPAQLTASCRRQAKALGV